jgi:urea transporter
MKSLSDDIFYAYANLVFVKNRFVGFLLLAATFFNINIALQGLVALAVSIAFARFIGIKKDDPVNKLFSYNVLITGFAVGFLFKVTGLSVLLTFGISIFTVLLTYTLSSIFYNYLKLPILNIPFTISATVIYLASGKYSSLIVDSFYKQEHFNLEFLPGFVQGLLRASGILVFMPYDIIGLIILIALLIYSRITFTVAVLSYYAGIFFLALLKGSLPLAFAEISSFNFILVGISMGGMFLIASKRTYLLTLTAVLTSVFIIDAASVFWISFGIPVFTLPFNLTVLLYIYVLGSVKYPMMNQTSLEKPEKSFIDHLNYSKRFDWKKPALKLPFMGEWTVYQGFNGEWTHKGAWSYAYDFVLEIDGRTYKNNGNSKEDYYCFGKPVVSPADGTVIEAYDELEDNQPPNVDKINNWGNYIIIWSDNGYYIELSHLRQASLKIKKGDRVEKGEPLAECGNSGYSPEPHLHIQVQYSHLLGSPGADFCFYGFMKNRSEINNSELMKGDKVNPLHVSKKMTRLFQFILDENFDYEYTVNGNSENISIIVKMEVDGTYYFSDGRGNKLYFGTDKDRFVFYKYDGGKDSILKYFFIALPSFSLSDETGLSWEEYIPDNVLSFSKIPAFIKTFNKDAGELEGFYRKNDDGSVSAQIKQGQEVRAEITTVLSESKGICSIDYTSTASKVRIRKK